MPDSPKTLRECIKAEKDCQGVNESNPVTDKNKCRSKSRLKLKRKHRNVTDTKMELSVVGLPKVDVDSHLESKAIQYIKGDKTDEKVNLILKTRCKNRGKLEEKLLLHLTREMKPFTLKILAEELETAEVTLHSPILNLKEKGIVCRKEIGGKVKKEIYWVDIDNALQELYGEKQINLGEKSVVVKQKLAKLAAQETSLLKEVEEVRKDMTNETLDIRLAEEERKLETLKVLISERRRRQINRMNLEKRKINFFRSWWIKRKQQCVDFIEMFAEAMEEHVKDMNICLGIVTDEMAGEVLPKKQRIN